MSAVCDFMDQFEGMTIEEIEQEMETQWEEERYYLGTLYDGHFARHVDELLAS